MEDIQISVQISDCTGKTYKFSTLRSLLEFCDEEQRFWAEKKNEITDANLHPCFQCDNAFSQIVTKGNDLVNPNSGQTPSQVSESVNQTIRHNPLSGVWLYSAHSFTPRVIETQEKYGKEAVSAFLDIIRFWPANQSPRGTNNLTDIQRLPRLLGYLSALDFKKTELEPSKASGMQSDSLDRLIKLYTTSKDELFKEALVQKESLHEQIQKLNNKASQQYLDQQEKFDNQMRELQNNITTLEHTYNEKLRLEGPAKYWEESEKKFFRDGIIWIVVLTTVAFFGIFIFRDLFEYWLSNHTLTEKITGIQSVQGVVLFTALAAIYAYVLRILARLIFSSFHLMRDAQERKQLTYLYLSLSKEPQAAMDHRSREIVLQALFSRSETGLLSNESGPTMPSLDAAQSVIKVGKPN